MDREVRTAIETLERQVRGLQQQVQELQTTRLAVRPPGVVLEVVKVKQNVHTGIPVAKAYRTDYVGGSFSEREPLEDNEVDIDGTLMSGFLLGESEDDAGDGELGIVWLRDDRRFVLSDGRMHVRAELAEDLSSFGSATMDLHPTAHSLTVVDTLDVGPDGLAAGVLLVSAWAKDDELWILDAASCPPDTAGDPMP